MDSQSIIKTNEEILLQFKNTAIRSRLKREITNMYALFNTIILNINEKNELIVTISEVINDKKQKYKFIISNHYPFSCPQIFFQNKPYRDFLTFNYLKEQSVLFKKITGKGCFCCHSFICNNNWSPAITLNLIIREINDIKKQRRNFINKILTDKIKFKYLIDDIDIESWLF